MLLYRGAVLGVIGLFQKLVIADSMLCRNETTAAVTVLRFSDNNLFFFVLQAH